MWVVPRGAVTRGVGCGAPIAPALGACTCGSATAGGENTCPAAGGANECTIGAAGGGIAGTTGAGAGGGATTGAGTAGAAPPTLPVCASASVAMTANIKAVVKTRNPRPGMAPFLRDAP